MGKGMIEKMKTLSLSSKRLSKEKKGENENKPNIKIIKKRAIPKVLLDDLLKTYSTPYEANIIPESIKNRDITKIKRINIKNFRGLKNIDLSIADNITLICGRNGTSKSTILGIVAQCFSFSIDYTKFTQGKYQTIPYKTLSGKKFISYAREHFRLSEKYDLTGSMDINIEVYDAINQTYLDKLQLRLTQEVNKQGVKGPRSRVRNNLGTDRAVTHPVIYLGLKRMFPISERKYEEKENEKFIQDNLREFLRDNNNILIKNSSSVATTVGIVNSIVAHSDIYDHQSVSVGEDNIGQILQAIYSFKKLKEEMGSEYRGGILLIDEIDASLFCAAQIRLMGLLEQYSKELNLQVIITSHSLEIMERVYKSSQKKNQDFKVHYLTNAFGRIELITNIERMREDIKDSFPEYITDNKSHVNIYTEDQEARDFLIKLCKDFDSSKYLNILNDIYIGCKNYKNFIQYRIPEFTQKSIIVLDGDNCTDPDFSKSPNVVCLPTRLPPDQLLFEYLLNKDEGHNFWKDNEVPRSSIITLPQSEAIINRLGINTGEKFCLESEITKYHQSEKVAEKPQLRKLFKNWYKSPQIQHLITQGQLYENWIVDNPDEVEDFLNKLRNSLKFVRSNS